MKKNKLFIVSLFFLPMLAASPGLGADKTTPLSDILKLAQENNTAIQSARKKWEAEVEVSPQKNSFPDPVFTFVYFKDELQTRAGPLEEKFAFSQKLPFFGKRRLNNRASEYKSIMSEEAYKAKSLEVFSKVSLAYYDLYFIDQSLKVHEELENQIRRFAKVTERKYSTGNASQSTVLRAQVELAKILNDTLTLKQKRISTRAQLKALLNHSLKEDIRPEKPDIMTTELNLSQLTAAATNYRPEIQGAQALIGQNEAQASLAVRDYFPDLTVGYELSKIGSGTTNMSFDGEDAQSLSFSLNLPIWVNRLNPQHREYKARQASAEALYEDWKNQTIYEVEDFLIQLETHGRLIKLYQDTVLPQAELALKSSQSGYESDRVPFLDLLDSVRTFLKFQLEYYMHAAQFGQTRAELERVLGLPLEQAVQFSEGVQYEK